MTAEDDHIAPWRQCYRIRKYVNVKAPVRFVLSSSGHILGIVNPPVNPPKRNFWVGEPERNEHFEHWFDRAEQKPGSWWEDWVTWLRPQCGPQVAPLSPASSDYPASHRRRVPTCTRSRWVAGEAGRRGSIQSRRGLIESA